MKKVLFINVFVFILSTFFAMFLNKVYEEVAYNTSFEELMLHASNACTIIMLLSILVFIVFSILIFFKKDKVIK